jgi:protein phosphatase-4 regulatory subunit 3
MQGRIIVKSEEDELVVLLDSKISHEITYQRQQDTLIVWIEMDAVDMALSFQESEGCLEMYTFINEVRHLSNDSIIVDQLGANFGQDIALPSPDIAHLGDIELLMQSAVESTGLRRDGIIRLVQQDDMEFISKTLALVPLLEDLEATEELHRLCNIVKSFSMFCFAKSNLQSCLAKYLYWRG